MTTIEKLVIQGVRAFDPDHREWISFSVPLTLIVGHNGAGKTTIIEALKYSTTGILPPGSKGLEFVHDPTLHGERETSAQLQLQLRTSEGAKVVGTRIMTVGVKRQKLSFATASNSILVVRDGDKATNSLPKGTMDIQMTKWLGVSPAVLDRVIFCHQDESLWPMAPPKDVKLHFDELFEIKKYADAIAQLKKLQSAQRIALGKHETTAMFQKQNREKGKGVDRECKKLSEQIAALIVKQANLKSQIEETQEKAQAAYDRANRAGAVLTELEAKQSQAQTTKQAIERIARNMQELDEDDDTLNDMVARYEEHAAKRRQDAKDHSDHLQSLKQSIEEARREQSRAVNEVGQGEAQQAAFERQIGNRKTLAREIAQRHHLREYNVDLDDERLRKFMERLASLVQEKGSAVNDAKREARTARQNIQQVIDSINAECTRLGSRKDNARKQVKDNNTKIDRLQREHDSIDVDDGAKVTLQANLQSLQQQLETARKFAHDAGYGEKVKSLESELERMNATEDAVSDEATKANENLTDTVQLDQARKKLHESRQRLEVMTERHRAKIADILHPDWSAANAKKLFDDKLEQESKALESAEKEQAGLNSKEEYMASQLSDLQRQLNDQNEAIKTAASAVNSVIQAGPPGYEEELMELERLHAELQTDADSCDVVRKLIEQQLRDAEVNGVCRTCTRAITKDKELENLRKNLDRQRARQDVAAITKDLTAAKEDLAQAKAVRPQVELWKSLSNVEVPALKVKIEQLEQQRSSLLQQLVAQDSLIEEHKSRRRDVDAISRAVKSITEDHDNILRYEQSISELSAKLKEAGMSRSLKQINDELAKIAGEKKQVTIRLNKIKDERVSSLEKTRALEHQVRDAQNDLDAADRQLIEKMAKAVEIDDLKADNREQKTTERDCDGKLELVRVELEQAIERRNDADTSAARIEDELQSEATEAKNSWNRLESETQGIQTYLDNDGPSKLERARAAVTRCEAEIKRLSDELDEGQIRLSEFEEALRDHDDTRRNIVDNIEWRGQTRALAELQKRIQELRTDRAEADYHEFAEQGKKFKEESHELEKLLSGYASEQRSKEEVLETKLVEYKQHYEHSALNYRTAYIQLETTKACLHDLTQYAAALDQAIMKFHSIKMEEINRTIDELWRKTYQGTDVDTIYIRSDAEGPNNKSYHYRVCMQKQQTEMDMRGRCSAGQKVLACIIIRLALAECFGSNCGLIALDEPTTNLDRENIEALATALAELIKVRKAQKNFQLIVITHDEEFLKHMDPSNYVDYYYRVSRDSKQKSQIKQEQIGYLMRH
ncbi:hypothetical protein AMS68_002551 [Peltaster fructicola]|uniref:Rad50/SbcC-type AAA domain-containing protein n=1 Tax=Peltaster fructicola TaxID=286661 RepID=A0A6H0XQM7_9PEZI|nr:hypothetical protein AMS68_002551 [Peltaster fructicola]